MKKIILLAAALTFIAAGCGRSTTDTTPTNGTSTIGTSTTKLTYINDAKTYEIDYPSNWVTSDCMNQGQRVPECVILTPSALVTVNVALVSAGKSTDTVDTLITRAGYKANGFDRNDMKINGNDSVYIVTKRPTYPYIDHTYYIKNPKNNETVVLNFREYEEITPEGQSPIVRDYKQYLEDYRSIVNSIQFN